MTKIIQLLIVPFLITACFTQTLVYINVFTKFQEKASQAYSK